jgi:hypothetical protein
MAVINTFDTKPTLEQIRDSIINLVKESNTQQHEIGRLYNYAVDHKLAELAGYRSAREYFSQNVKLLSQATLSAYGTVAKRFTAQHCTQYGMFNLRALLSYAQAADVLLGAEDPGTIIIDVPQEDGSVQQQLFADCSVEELERATRAKRLPPVTQVPVSDRALLLVLSASLEKHFQPVAPVRFSSRVEKGQTLVSLEGVPLTAMTLLMTAIQEGMESQPTGAERAAAATALAQ